MSAVFNLLPDGPHLAPIGANSTAIGGEPHVFHPSINNAIEVIVNGIQEARNGEAAVRATIRQYWCRRHEPEAGHIIVNALGMIKVIRIGQRNTRKHVLIRFPGQQISILQRRLAEIGQ